MSYKETNPKAVFGDKKLPIYLVPATMVKMACVAFLNGALKYGRLNWRVSGVKSSTYYRAARDHLDAWFEGEEVDPDDGVPHLAAVLACVGIIVDAEACGKLNDDRNFQGGYRNLSDRLTHHVERLKVLHAEKNPVHYTLSDQPLLSPERHAMNPPTPACAEIAAVRQLHQFHRCSLCGARGQEPFIADHQVNCRREECLR